MVWHARLRSAMPRGMRSCEYQTLAGRGSAEKRVRGQRSQLTSAQ